MKTLKVGQRINVYEVLNGNDFARIPGQDIKVGNHRVEINKSDAYAGVWLGSKYGECYHFPIEGQLKKIGALIITKVK